MLPTERDEYRLCDECHHEADLHRSLHDQPDPDWSTATCWAELICSTCERERTERDA